jgi:Uma2 family endonuclease
VVQIEFSVEDGRQEADRDSGEPDSDPAIAFAVEDLSVNMAAHPLPLSIEEFHRRFDGAKPTYEYWFGEAIQKPMPTVLHGIVQLIVAMLLERAGWNTSPEVRLKIVPDAEPVPDLIAIRGKFKNLYPTIAPELCVEILSSGDTLPRAFKKAERYVNWGSQCVWIIDPEKRTAWTLSAERMPEPVWVPPNGVLRIGETSIELEALFAEVEKKIETSLT